MTGSVLFSVSTKRLEWAEACALSSLYGPKGALLLALPRKWVPHFALLSCEKVDYLLRDRAHLAAELAMHDMLSLVGPGQSIIVRSSVIDETIWERGSFHSEPVFNMQSSTTTDRVFEALMKVRDSAVARKAAVVLQEYIEPQFHGEFGNLARVSKTRDHWEVGSVSVTGAETRERLNSQRDIAADADNDLGRYIRPSDPRSFGAIAAWINSELLYQTHCRVNLEWVYNARGFFLVQIDEESEDVHGVNPFQVRFPTVHSGQNGTGRYIKAPTPELIKKWDKLAVLEELWTRNESNKPLLFSICPDELDFDDAGLESDLCSEFSSVVGPDKIIIRTSIRQDKEKITNLPRSEGLLPAQAAKWCIDQARGLQVSAGLELGDFSFVTHRLIPSRASAWAYARPDSPEVEIHVNWGFADALQYYPFDIIDVHVPTKKISYTPQYKSHCILPRPDGTWQNSRVKNEVARNQCATRGEALEIAERSVEIARNLKMPCHIMWFVGCMLETGDTFNVPWYWTKADEERPNPERPTLRSILIKSRDDLSAVAAAGPLKGTFSLELAPVDVNLMRDNRFLDEVADLGIKSNAPIILRGSTLAHAYYQLQKAGCNVVPSSARQIKRTRSIAPMGKLVRDKIPAKILKSEETAWTRLMPDQQVLNFLVGKLLEELLEFRRAKDAKERREELADALEVLLSLIKRSGLSMDEVSLAATRKREKAGGFDQGVVLFETSIGGRRSEDRSYSVMPVSSGTGRLEIPYTFFGFGHFDRSVKAEIPALGVDAFVKLENDRLSIELVRQGEQLDLDFDDADEDVPN